MSFRIALSLVSILLLSSAALPKKGPLPEKKPVTVEVPVPAEKPEEKAQEETDMPAKAEPAPAKDDKEKPAPADEDKKDAPPADDKATVEKPEPVLTIKPEDGKEYTACLADLKAIGAVFEETKRIDDGKGCGIDKPLTVTTVLPGITLKPEGTMRCETALELARWTKDAVLPAAKAALEEEGPLTTINQASSYVCRLRNNAKTGKISEHARGNAIDIASFTFKSGKSIEIQPRDEDSTLAGAFQRAVTATGCLYFETVLDPGSDEAHENHLHFDVIERKGGYRYCR
ncbi:MULTISPECIES: extensin family protein [unclassified Rhizobium]|uniref:extensin-like domain-containing protein n=1 Tax=unclassified Rhizobium TaxID=2613769 RepID=UPI000712E846|nr:MULTISPECIES: extensin family protein [unclassified Rhizobium]KQS99167.1 extensin [Rhizobium sp. Leaf386]KQT05359.1 extensin [Rhizobium sp. Leaf391]KQT91801.1 extensin [Rhizobium sp. Leaf453]